MIAALDRGWLAAHPLPPAGADADKNSRGRVLLVAGAEYVPGAPRLTGEAALHVGAGKLQMATVASIAVALGVLMPEAAMIALPHNAEGEIAASAADVLADRLAACDTLVLGPGMSAGADTEALTRALLSSPREGLTVVLDAGPLTSARHMPDLVRHHGGRVLMTPHHGEMARLCGLELDEVASDPAGCARRVAGRFGAHVVLKSAETLIATPDGAILLYRSDCPGLATGGSGDVLAGAIGGLAARGTPPLVAAGWAVWAHGQAGRELAEREGAVGFLSRELPSRFPRLLARAAGEGQGDRL